MKKLNTEKGFWVFNMTKKNVSLADLALTIPAGRRFNLLDSKHFHYTLAQLEASKASGSLFNKRDRIIISEIAPDIIADTNTTLSKVMRSAPPRSALKIEEKHYPELPSSDEKFADEFSDPNDT